MPGGDPRARRLREGGGKGKGRGTGELRGTSWGTPPLTFGCAGGLGELAVDVPHHARRLLVALRVDVPQHQQRPAPGELEGEEAAQAAARPGDEAHLPGHALLLGPHQPLGGGQHESPEHPEGHHEELQQDVHAAGPEPPPRGSDTRGRPRLRSGARHGTGRPARSPAPPPRPRTASPGNEPQHGSGRPPRPPAAPLLAVSILLARRPI